MVARLKLFVHKIMVLLLISVQLRMIRSLHQHLPRNNNYIRTSAAWSAPSSKSVHDTASLRANRCLHNFRRSYNGYSAQRASVRCFASAAAVQQLLVCGDGDLSYSALIAPDVDSNEMRLTATVLESEPDHQRVYQNSTLNANGVTSHGHTVKFEVDATDLISKFGSEHKFDMIQFNFPHWIGKSNNKYNRELLANFLKSAEKVMTDDGEIRVSLFEHQSGVTAKNSIDWKGSWLAPQLAAEAGLLLKDVSPFKIKYTRSSYRGNDKAFYVGPDPQLLKFVKPREGLGVLEDYQLCCRHELHVTLPQTDVSSEEKVLSSEDICKAIQESLPDGIICDVLLTDIIGTEKTGLEAEVTLFMIIYRGAKTPITRDVADAYRSRTEEVLSEVCSLRQNKLGRTISKPIPYFTLKHLLSDFIARKDNAYISDVSDLVSPQLASACGK